MAAEPRRAPVLSLRQVVAKYQSLASDFGEPAALTGFGLTKAETEQLFSDYNEDYHIRISRGRRLPNFCRNSLLSTTCSHLQQFVDSLRRKYSAHPTSTFATEHPIGVSSLTRSRIHFRTRTFSPKPGHRNLPSAPLRNQFTWKILGG